jgi:hypothetical protein
MMLLIVFFTTSLDYPRTTIDFGNFSFPWTCGHNLGFEACEAAHTVTSLEDKVELNREYAYTNDNCSAKPDTVPIDVGNDNDDVSSSATFGRVLTMTMVGAIGVIGATA